MCIQGNPSPQSTIKSVKQYLRGFFLVSHFLHYTLMVKKTAGLKCAFKGREEAGTAGIIWSRILPFYAPTSNQSFDNPLRTFGI